jgi:hypothetical protein
MSYVQRFGLSRKSPLSNENESKTPSSDVFGDLDYKTQSERGMSDSEYSDQYEMGNIHNPVLDGVIMRSGVDYDDFYNKYGEDANFEEHMKKNLTPEEYKRSLAENFSKDPYYEDIMRKGLEGRSDYSSASNIIPTPSVDDVQAGLDYASVIDPTPLSDGLNLAISGTRAGIAAATGDVQGAKRFGKKALASGFYMIPGTDVGKLGKLNKFGKSKGRVYKPGMFMPESSKRNLGRGITNFAFRKGQNTKLSDKIKSGISGALGNNKVSGVIGKKTSELVSGKGIVKGSKVGEQKET